MIIDEEELEMLQKMKELKKVYRAAFDALKSQKTQLNLVQQSIDQGKIQLVSTFEEWYSESFEAQPE